MLLKGSTHTIFSGVKHRRCYVITLSNYLLLLLCSVCFLMCVMAALHSLSVPKTCSVYSRHSKPQQQQHPHIEHTYPHASAKTTATSFQKAKIKIPRNNKVQIIDFWGFYTLLLSMVFFLPLYIWSQLFITLWDMSSYIRPASNMYELNVIGFDHDHTIPPIESNFR